MRVVKPSPASASPHQVSTDSIVVVCSSFVVCLLQPAFVCVCGVCVLCVLCVCGVSKWRKAGNRRENRLKRTPRRVVQGAGRF